MSDEIKLIFGSLFKSGCDTQWFSKYDAVLDFLNKKKANPEAMQKFYGNHKKLVKRTNGAKEPELVELKAEEEDFLNEYVKVLNPLATTCKLIQGEKGTYWGFHSLFVLKIITSLSKMTDLVYCDPLKEALLHAVKTR